MQHQMQKNKSVFNGIFVLAVGIASIATADWPQFQGPARNGFSPETGIARSWPEGGPKELWTTSVGEGFGGAAIRDGEVYILDRESGVRDILRCLSLETGRELWRYAYSAPSKVSYPGSRTTPTVTEKYVYIVGVMGDFHCIDRNTHEPVWHHDLVEKFSMRGVPNWGISQAPSVYEDLVIVAPQSPTAAVAAFNRYDGELVWTSPAIAGVGYVSPVITTLHGVDQVVMFNPAGRRQPGAVSGISIEDGTVLWTYTDWVCRIPIPCPTILEGNRVFITGGYGAGSTLFQVIKTENGFDTQELFSTQEFGSQIHQPLLISGALYGNSNSNARKHGMACLALDGTLKWRTKDIRGLPKFDFGNLIGVDGLILNLEGRKGSLHLIQPSTEGYKELARAQIFDGTKMWSPMAFSDGKLVLRSQTEMKCLDLRNP